MGVGGGVLLEESEHCKFPSEQFPRRIKTPLLVPPCSSPALVWGAGGFSLSASPTDFENRLL